MNQNANRSSLFPLLDERDVSRSKLLELQDRLIRATNAGRVKWERGKFGDLDSWAVTVPSGIVEVSPAGAEIWNDSGQRIRQFRYPTNDLYVTVRGWHDKQVESVIGGLLAELDAMAVAE